MAQNQQDPAGRTPLRTGAQSVAGAQPAPAAALNKPASLPVQTSLLSQPASAALAMASEDSGDGLHFEASSKNAHRQNDATAKPLVAQNEVDHAVAEAMRGSNQWVAETARSNPLT